MREGEIDPFDKVAQEGSSLRRDLIDIDEIFVQHQAAQFGVTERTRAASKPQTVALEEDQGTESTISKALSRDANKADFIDRNGSEGPGLLVGNGQLFLAQPAGRDGRDGDGVQVERERPRLRNPKVYYLMDDRSRVQGPLAARDILRLYYKGVVGPGIFVVRRDSKIRIPVARFVAALSRQQGVNPLPLGGPGRGHHPALKRSARPARLGWREGALDGAKSRSVILGIPASLVAAFLVLAALTFGAAAAWLVLSSSGSPKKAPPLERKGLSGRADKADGGLSPRPRVLFPSHGSGTVGVPKANQEAASREKQSGASAETRVQPPQSTLQKKAGSKVRPRDRRVLNHLVDREARSPDRLGAKMPPKAKSSRLEQATSARPRPRSIAAAPRPILPLRNPARAAVSSSVLAPRPLLAPRGPSIPSTPVGPPRPAIRPAPPQIVSGSPIASANTRQSPNAGQLALKDGQTVSAIGPFTFDRRAVAQCQAACTISFKGAVGVVTGKFFKSIWGPILLEKNGPVRLSGLIRRSGAAVKIIISDIQ